MKFYANRCGYCEERNNLWERICYKADGDSRNEFLYRLDGLLIRMRLFELYRWWHFRFHRPAIRERWGESWNDSP